VVKDISNLNTYAGLPINVYQFSVLDTTNPTILPGGFVPAPGATAQLKSISIILTFSEVVQAGSGILQLSPSGGNGLNNPVLIDVTSSQVSFTGEVMTINPEIDLIDTGGRSYGVTMAAGIVKDTQSNIFQGINASAYSFTLADTTAPLLQIYNPAREATGQSKSTNIVLTFGEYVQAGTGNIVLVSSGGNGPDTTYQLDVTSTASFSNDVMTIDPPNDLLDTGLKLYTVTMASGVVKDLANNPFSGISGTVYRFQLYDSTPPQITTYSPPHNAVQQHRAVPIVLTFNEDILAGAGNIVLSPTGGNGFNNPVSIPITDSQVSIAGSTLTIQPSPALVDTGGKLFTVTMPEGVVKDLLSNQHAGISGSTYTFTVYDSTAPLLLSTTPVQGSVGHAKSTSITLTFNEHVKAGSGSISVTSSGGVDGVRFQMVLNVTSPHVNFTQNKVVITPPLDLDDTGNKTYSVSFGAWVIMGYGNNPFGGLNSTAYSFEVPDVTPPVILTVNPAANSKNLSKATDFVITFDETVQAGSGDLVLTPSGGTGSNIPYSIDISSAEITIVDKVVTINPAQHLADAGGKDYALTMAAGFLKDVISNPVAELTDSEYRFAVASSRVPDTPQNVQLTVISQNTLRIIWSIPFNGNSPLLGYKLYTWRETCGLDVCYEGVEGSWDSGTDYDPGVISSGTSLQPHSGQRSSLVISKVPVAQTYKFRLSAYNDIGASVYGTVQVVTLDLCRRVEVNGTISTWFCNRLSE